MHMKAILTCLLLSLASITFAQDVIVQRDGSTILSKVVEVGTTEVKYKKYSNLDGPTYAILKSDIMVINYENGQKDTFNNASSAPATTSADSQPSIPFEVNPNLENDNLQLVQAFNSTSLNYVGDDTKKKCIALALVLGLKEGSIIETPELKATFEMKVWHGRVALTGSKVKGDRTLGLGEPSGFNFENYQFRLVVKLTNKTDKPLYIDLHNCFLSQNGVSSPYDVLSETTIGTTGRANGNTGVGTGSERIMTIPAGQTLALSPQNIGEGFTWETSRNGSYQHDIVKAYLPYFKEKGYATDANKFNVSTIFGDLHRGETVDIPMLENVSPLSAMITYSYEETMKATQKLHMDFYVRQVMGCKDIKATGIDFSQCPLIFFSYTTIIDLIKT